MADLERRLAPRVAVLRLQSRDGRASLTVAPRLMPDRATALVREGEHIVGAGSGGGTQEVISHDVAREIAVVRVPAVDDGAVAIRQGAPRSGPRYVGVVEATTAGPAVRPVYVGRIDGLQDPQTGMPVLSLTGVQHALPRGAAVFTLEGAFIGLVRESADTTLLVSGETLRSAAESAQPVATPVNGRLGVEIDGLTAALRRATGAAQGVVVVHVDPSGPANGSLQSGDVIQTIGGTPVTSATVFRQLERGRPPGAEVALTGTRRRAPFTVSLKAGDAAGPVALSGDDPGFVGQNIAGAGIEVVTVSSGGPAARAGLQRGDLITELDGEPARDAAALARRFRSAASGAALLLTVQRGQQYRVVALEKH